MKDIREKIKQDLISKIKRLGNGEKVNYNTEPHYLNVEIISEDIICEVVEELDESGNFEGYLDKNGVDQDWSLDIEVNGNKIEMWGSAYSGSCLLQSK